MNKILVTSVMLSGAAGLLWIAASLVNKAFTGSSTVFHLTTGRGAQGITSIELYLALLSFVAALGILALIKYYGRSK